MASDNPFVEIEAIVAALHPRHRQTRAPPVMEDDAPARLRALWEALGQSEATGAMTRPLLTREASRADLDRVFADWSAEPRTAARWGGGAQALWQHVPARFRLVLVMKSELAFTDETGAADDPPVLVMQRSGPPVAPWHRSYTEWLIWRLLRALTVHRSLAFNTHSGLAGTPVASAVYPRLEALADGVWWMAMPDFAPTESKPSVTKPLFYRSLESFFEYLGGLPDDKLAYFASPPAEGLVVSPPGPLDIVQGCPPSFRCFGHIALNGKPLDRVRAALGRAGSGASGGAAPTVRLAQMLKSDEVTVRFDPRRRDEVRAWLQGLSVAIKEELPLPDGYDRMGW